MMMKQNSASPGPYAEDAGSTTAPSRREQRDVPAAWGRDPLTQFFDFLERQAHSTFVANSQFASLVSELDRVVCERLGDLFHEPGQTRVDAVGMFIRAWSVYRAAARLAFSGQLFETNVLLRSMLECSVYGWTCWTSEQLSSVWRRRDESVEALRECRRQFQWSKLMERLHDLDVELENSVSEQYNTLISQGAHPNQLGIAITSEQKQVGRDKFVLSTKFSDGTPDVVKYGLLQCVRTGQYSFWLMRHCVRERLQILRIETDMQAFQRRILDVFRQQGID